LRGIGKKVEEENTLNKLTIATTSWDDGYPQDLRIADLLQSKKMGGTFYVPFRHEWHPVLSGTDLRALMCQGFEIGGHSISHLSLPALPLEQIDREVQGCKKMLEDILGERITSFCYPRGRFNNRVKQRLINAGYANARTTRMLATGRHFDPLEMPTTVQAYPHRKLTYLKNLTKARNFEGFCNYAIQFGRVDSWVELGKRLFDSVLRNGGIWHLYGHSWEIQEMRLWDDLEELLQYVSLHNGVAYLSNGEAAKLLSTTPTKL
jgi:hypothetical protein